MKLLALALLAGAAALGASERDDERREPFRIGVGYHLANPVLKNWTSIHGWALGADARLPFLGLLGTPHLDGDWRANKGAQGRFDGLSLMYVERRSMDSSGVYIGGGAGLAWNRLLTEPPATPPQTWFTPQWNYVTIDYYMRRPDVIGFRPVAKLLAGYEWPKYHLGVEAAWIVGPSQGGVRTDGVVATAIWRFGSQWYRP